MAAVGDSVLLDVSLLHWVRRGRGPGRLSVTVLTPNAKEPEQTGEMRVDQHGLFDVTDLVA